MKVFLSWAGTRSKHVALALCGWLPKVIQSTKPWISSDITKGESWDESIHQALRESDVAIICLTSDSLESNYLHYEVGAIASNKSALAATFLLDIKPSDVKQPLSRFQTTKFDKEDISQLLKDINNKVGQNGGDVIAEITLNEIFEVWWPMLKTQLDKVPASEAKIPTRAEREILEDVISTVRDLQQNVRSEFAESRFKDEVKANFLIQLEDLKNMSKWEQQKVIELKSQLDKEISLKHNLAKELSITLSDYKNLRRQLEDERKDFNIKLEHLMELNSKPSSTGSI